MSTKPTFSDTVAGIFLQLGTVPAEVYLKNIHDRLPEGTLKRAFRGSLKEGKEGIERASKIMREELERQRSGSKIEVPDTDTVAAINAERRTK